MSLLIGRHQSEIVRPRLRDRLRCWRRGGHLFYWNREFGDLWCGDCGGVWHLGSDPFSRETLSGRSFDFNPTSS